MKELLASMIVEGVKMSALYKLRRLVRTQGDNNLGLVHQAQMIFQTSEVPISKKECVNVLMGKLSLSVRNKIIELNDVDQILFWDVISYFKKKHKEYSYK